jgi:hypothetical protein
MEEQITTGLRLNRQNSAAFESQESNPALTAGSNSPRAVTSGG